MFKTELFYFIRNNKKNFGLLILTQILTTFFLFLNNIILTRYFDIDNFGFYKFIIAVFSIGGTFSIGGFSKSLIISSAKSFGGNFKIILVKRFLIACLISIPVIFIIFYNDDGYHPYIYVLLFLVFPFYTIQSHWKLWLEGSLNFKKYFNFNLLLFILLIILSTALLLFKPIYSIGLISLFIFKCFIEFFFNYLVNLKLNNKINGEIIRKGYSFTIGEIYGITSGFNILIVSYFLDLKSIALYSIILIFPAIIKSLFALTNKVLNKKIINFQNLFVLNKYFKDYFFFLIFLFLIIGLIGFFTIPYVIKFIYPPEYSEVSILASKIFLIFCLNLPISYFSNAITLLGNSNFFKNYQLLNSIFQIPLMIMGLYYFGLSGVILPYIGTVLFSNIYTIYFLKNH